MKLDYNVMGAAKEEDPRNSSRPGSLQPTGGLPFAPQYMQLLAMLNPDDRAQMLRAFFAPESDGEDNSDFDEDENDGDEQ